MDSDSSSLFRLDGKVVYHDNRTLATFPVRLKTLLSHEGRAIILLDVLEDRTISSDDEFYGSNVFCLNPDGSILWRLPAMKSGGLIPGFYVWVDGIFNGHFFKTSNTNGYTCTVDADTGALLDPVYEK